MGRNFGTNLKGSVELDWSAADQERVLVEQLVRDANVVWIPGREAFRGYAADSQSTARLREARALLCDLLSQDIETFPEDKGGPKIQKGSAKSWIRSWATRPATAWGRDTRRRDSVRKSS